MTNPHRDPFVILREVLEYSRLLANDGPPPGPYISYIGDYLVDRATELETTLLAMQYTMSIEIKELEARADEMEERICKLLLHLDEAIAIAERYQELLYAADQRQEKP